MPDSSISELIQLSDEEQGITLHIIEGMSLSGSDRYDALRAEILVSTEFVSGRVELYLNAHDLDSWADVLDSVDAGRKATWLESGRSPRVMVAPDEESESGCTEVSVYDVTGSQVFVTVPIVTPPDWIGRHRRLLTEIRNRFPLVR
ncbi:DUF5959 family protein [Streptomyces caeni]|uniref:DUF5959 family protein n=1 Tax=Streptomyces caeni TaxID=2307231 RepID=A0ABW4J0W2_9ACTN